MDVNEKFELSNGITVLSCAGYNPKFDVIGKEISLVHGDEVRQTLTISCERKMINQKLNPDQRVFETTDTVLLSQDEARSGEWQLVRQ